LGNFLLETRTGTFRIAAVRPGYKSILSAPVPLEKGERLTIRVPIAIDRDPQHQIGVTEHIRPGGKEGDGQRRTPTTPYEARQRSGIGLHYFRAQLEKSGLSTLGQFLMTVPGLTVMDPRFASSMQTSRSQAFNEPGMPTCRLGWFVDGRRMD